MHIKITTIGWWGAYPSSNEATSGYLLQTERLNLLLDCGSGVLACLQNHVALEDLDAVVLSHYHWDHMADIGCLQYASRILMDLGKRTKPLQIYGHTEDDFFAKLNYLTFTRARPISATRKIEIGSLDFTFGRNIHPDPCLSMRIEGENRVLAYISDTAWTDDLVRLAQDADLLICESSLYDAFLGMIPGHLTAGEAGTLAARAGVQKLVLSHLPHYGEHQLLLEQAQKNFHGAIELASTGKVWKL